MVGSCNLGIYGVEEMPVSKATGATIAALKQATNRLLLAVSEENEDSGKAQKKDVKKTLAKRLSSTLSKSL